MCLSFTEVGSRSRLDTRDWSAEENWRSVSGTNNRPTVFYRWNRDSSRRAEISAPHRWRPRNAPIVTRTAWVEGTDAIDRSVPTMRDVHDADGEIWLVDSASFPRLW